MRRLLSRSLLLFAAALPPATPATVLDVAALSRDISPCEDFYAYANRAWLDSARIPGDRPDWNTFRIIDQRNREWLRAHLERSAKANPYPAGSNRHKVVAYFASGMDEAAIERDGTAPLVPLFNAIEAVKAPGDLPRALAALHRHGVRAAFAFTVFQDAKDAQRHLPQVSPAGLGLPDRDYYFRDDARSVAQREAYVRHLERVFGLAGADAKARADLARRVLSVETELARAELTRVERRDPQRTYNRRTVEDLGGQAPGFDWKAYFAATGAAPFTDLNLTQPAHARAFAALASARPVADWRAYLRWQVLMAASPRLPRAFEEAHFDFYERTLTGVQEPGARADRVIRTIAGPYGGEPLAHALGEIFVAAHFPPEAKAKVLEMVAHVKAAFRERLVALDWMEETTRRAALDKLDRVGVKMGYPDRWRDFSAAEVGERPYAANWLAANAFEFQRVLARIGQPVDRGEWWMSPHIVNAYAGSSRNEIVFPAAILQPPFFDVRADDAVNYGGIGMVIGHEITHLFDDRGRQYDAAGNLRDWWAPADAARYGERAQRLVAQYAAYPGVDGLSVNGALTLGENISDVGGLQIAYFALQRSLAGKPREAIDGLTPEQRFFIAFAQAWRASVRPEQERLRLLTDSHSPPRHRVRGAVANFSEFARAFSCPADAPMLRAEGERVLLW